MNRAAKFSILAAVVLAVAGGGLYGWEAHWSPAAKSKAFVKRKLTDPDSAKFGAHFPAVRGGENVWCGTVNARNRLGGMVGYTRYVLALKPPIDGIDGIDPDILSDITFDQGDESFAGKWRLMCER